MMDESEFEQHINGILSSGFVTMGLALGRETGLFQVLMSADAPLTSPEIAQLAGLKERYVREWLGIMVSASIVSTDENSNQYHIPTHYRKALKMPVAFSPGLLVFAKRHEAVKASFQQEGPNGYDYSEMPEWYDWFDTYRSEVIDDIVQEFKDSLKGFGLLSYLESGIRVADIGSGTGSFTIALAKSYPQSKFVGIETCTYALQKAKVSAQSENLSNVTFECQDANHFPQSWNKSFDWIMIFDTLHDMTNPEQVLSQCHNVLKDDGYLCIMEEAVHSDQWSNRGSMRNAFMYAASCYVCLPASLAKEPRRGYGTCWGMEAMEETFTKYGYYVSSKTVIRNKKSCFYILSKQASK